MSAMKEHTPFATVVSANAIAVAAFAWGSVTRIAADLALARSMSTIGIDVVNLALHCVLAWFAFRAPSLSRAAGRLAAGAAVLGVAHHLVVSEPAEPRLKAIVAAAVLATFFAGYAAVFARLLWSQVQARSHESADRALARAGAWVAIPTALTFVVSLLVHRWNGYPASVAFGFGVVLPAALSCVALARLRGRRRWLASVESGQQPRWRIVSETAPDLALPRVATGAGIEARTLVRVHAPDEPFREAERLEPVATVGAAERAI